MNKNRARYVLITLVITVGIVLFCIWMMKLKSVGQTQSIVSRLPTGWLVTSQGIYDFPSGHLLYKFPQGWEAQAFKRQTGSVDLLIRSGLRSWESPMIHYRWESSTNRLTEIGEIRLPSNKPGNYVSFKKEFDASGKIFAQRIYQKFKDRPGSSIIGVRFVTLSDQSSFNEPEFLSAHVSSLPGCFWVLSESSAQLYNALQKQTVGRKFENNVFTKMEQYSFQSVSQGGKVLLAKEVKRALNYRYDVIVVDAEKNQTRNYSIHFSSALGMQFIGEEHILIESELPLIGRYELWILELATGHYFRWKAHEGMQRYPVFIQNSNTDLEPSSIDGKRDKI
ncbi:MAG: hypothetical protein KIT45_13800 [Fimbriimonadia bacterium]|nr:hypothetical protein [Fimbriimonadia bacterium]